MSSHPWLVCRRVVLLVFWMTAVPSFALAQAGIAPNGDPGSGFGIDADLQANTPNASTTDWVAGPNGSGIALVSDGGVPSTSNTFHGLDAFDGTDQFIASGQGKWSVDPNGWRWITGFVAGKDNLNHGLVHFSADASGHLWITWAMDRQSAGGASFLDCSLWQGTLTKNAGGTFTSTAPASGSFNAGYTDGDLILTIDLPDTISGQLPSLLITQRIGGAWVGVPLSATTAFVTWSKGLTPSVPYGAFGSLAYPSATFAEAAVDLTALVAANFPGQQVRFQTLFFSDRSSNSLGASFIDIVDPIPVAIATAVEGQPSSAELSLERVRPDPATPPVRVVFALPQDGRARLGIFDASGRRVAALADGFFSAGRHAVTWSASSKARAGIYFVRLEVEGRSLARSFALTR
jgi:hypothetical protein